MKVLSCTNLSIQICLPAASAELPACVQEGLLAEATAFRDANIVDVQTYDDLKAAIEAGKWARGRWAGLQTHPISLQSIPTMAAGSCQIRHQQLGGVHS